MTEPKDGGPAFQDVPGGGGFYTGMSLRDWFAGQALVGLINQHMSWDNNSVDAYDMADAMLVERAKRMARESKAT